MGIPRRWVEARLARMGNSDITDLLQRWSGGSPEAFEQLVPLVYDELRHMAGSLLRGEREGHILQPTALVHELYLRMIDQDRASWEDRSHFFAVAAKMMRRILVDHARKRVAGKRGGGAQHVLIEDALDHPADTSQTILAVHEALTRFAAFDPERSRIVELRYFGGLDLEEIAELLQVSRTTVKRQWTVARMWLHRELEADANGSGALEGD